MASLDLIIGTQNTYQQPYDPTTSIGFFHNLPRGAGHPDDISTVFSGDVDDIENYSKGLIFLGSFLITFFGMWFLVIFLFKILGNKNVGFLSGNGFATDSTISKVVRYVFLFSSIMAILFCILLAALGVNGFQNNTLSTFDDTNDEVKVILDQFATLIDSHATVGAEAAALRNSLDNFLSQDVCPGRPGTVDEITIRQVASDVQTQLLALEDFIGADLGDVKIVLDDSKLISDEVQLRLSDAHDATSGTVYAFVIPVIFLSCSFLVALVVAYKKKIIRWLLCTVSWVIIPIFIVAILISLFACVGVTMSAEANSDFCSGGDEDTPEATIVAIMDQFGVRKDLLGYQIAIFYIFQCSGADNPFDFFSKYNFDLQTTREAIQNYQSEIQGQSVEDLSRVCGVDYRPVYDDLVSIASKTDTLIGLAQDGIEVISCPNIVPLYTSLIHEAACNESMKSQTWAFSSLLLITTFGMVMVTLRAAYQPIGGDVTSKDEQTLDEGAAVHLPTFNRVVTPAYNPSHDTGQVIVTVNREYQGQKLGMSLGMSTTSGTFHVSRLASESPFSSTRLKEGMEIQEINGVDLTGQTLNGIMELLEGSMTITIVAQHMQSGFETPYPSTAPTISNIRTNTVDEPLPSLTSNANRHFSDEPPPSSPNDNRPSYVVQRSLDSHPAPTAPSRLVVTVAKVTKDQRLGLTLARDQRGQFTVSVLSPSSPFSIMGLEEGMKVISINDVEITGQQMDVVLWLLKESIGDVSVTAEESPAVIPPPPSDTDEPAEYEVGYKTYGGAPPIVEAQLLDPAHPLHDPPKTKIRAVCTKSSREEKLGVSLKRNQDGLFTVSELSTDSLFQGTGLAVGMQVISINRIDVTGFDMSMVTTILRNSVGEVAIEAIAEKDSEWF